MGYFDDDEDYFNQPGMSYVDEAIARRRMGQQKEQQNMQNQINNEQRAQNYDWGSEAAQGYALAGPYGAAGMGVIGLGKNIAQSIKDNRKAGRSGRSAIGRALANTLGGLVGGISSGRALTPAVQAAGIGSATDGMGIFGKAYEDIFKTNQPSYEQTHKGISSKNRAQYLTEDDITRYGDEEEE